MGGRTSCLISSPHLSSFLPKNVVESALARNDFDTLKAVLLAALKNNVQDHHHAPSSLKLNRMYGDETLIQLAVKFQRVDVVELLLQLGASPDKTLKSALSALTRAIIVNNEEIFNALIQYDSDPNLSSDDGVTPLTYAIIVNRPFAVTALLSHSKIELNRADVLGMTALHHACKCRSEASVQFVEQLLKAGAKWDLRDLNGATPLHLAVRSARKVAIFCDHLRLENGSDPSSSLLHEALVIRDKSGQNVLHRALMKEETESAVVLLANGAIFGLIPQIFVERVLTSVISANSPYILRNLLLCLPDPSCCYFSASVTPPAGLFDMAFTMRRFDMAIRLSRAACLPRSRRPKSKRISVLISDGFNAPCSLQSFARLAVRRSIPTTDPRRYEAAVSRLNMPDEITSFLLYFDVERMPVVQNLPTAVQLPDLAGLRRSDEIEENNNNF